MTRRWFAAPTLLVLLVLAGCTGRDEPGNPTVPPLPSAPGTSTAGTTTSPVPGGTKALPVYYVVDTAAGFRLYREFHAVPSSDPGSDAVREMLAKPTGIDPDYRSSWPAGTTLRAPVTHDGAVITVDLSGQARAAQVGSELAERTVQQLVYTVEGALQSTDPVRILIDGQPAGDLWGHVDASQPVRRADPTSTRSLVQIDSPAHGARVGRTFTVTGEASAFEANVPWQVLRDGAVVQSGNATAAEGQRFSAFSFSLTLDPGDYTLRVVEDDPSGGEGRGRFEDTKAITVTG